MPTLVFPAAEPVFAPENLARFAPCRRPDWRFREILESLTCHPRPPRRWGEGDLYLRPMLDFLYELRSGQAPLASRGAVFSGPSAAWALARTRHPLTRLVIDCRILARQSLVEIARLQNLPAIAVEWYAHIFFDVQDRLEASDWIIAQVLHGAGLRVQTDPRVTIKQLAYCGGPAVADYVIAALPPVTDDQAPPNEDAFFASMPVADPALRAAIELNASKRNPKNVLSLLKSACQIAVNPERARKRMARKYSRSTAASAPAFETLAPHTPVAPPAAAGDAVPPPIPEPQSDPTAHGAVTPGQDESSRVA